MTASDPTHAADPAPPIVRQLTLADLWQSLREGAARFASAPLYSLFFGAVYAAGGWLILATIYLLDLPYLAYPTAAGFALIAPFACAGVYDLSRRLERGDALSWPSVLRAPWSYVGTQLGWLSLVCLFTLVIWVDFAWTLFLAFYGLRVPSLSQLAVEVVTTPTGVLFFLVGNGVGAVVAFVVFSITVVSPTLLVDRDIDFVTAMLTSVRVVLANPIPMFAWAATIGALLALSLATGLVGLCVVLPVLGHASWALYRRVVA